MGDAPPEEMARSGERSERLPVLRQANERRAAVEQPLAGAGAGRTPGRRGSGRRRRSRCRPGAEVAIERWGRSSRGSAAAGARGRRLAGSGAFPGAVVVRAKFNTAVDQFRTVGGRSDLPVGEAAEAFAAEWRIAPRCRSRRQERVRNEEKPKAAHRNESAREETARRRANPGAARAVLRGGLQQVGVPLRVRLRPAGPSEWLSDYDVPLSNDVFDIDRELWSLTAARRSYPHSHRPASVDSYRG